jgi:proline iminopeptidase
VGESRFELNVDGCVLRGHRSGSGAPALLLHGGAAVPDYLGECAAQLDGRFETVRYTQRGTRPSDARGPYTIERHVADAVAVLDWLGPESAWAIGHSWGGHLALHLALAHADRLRGLLLISPLGADPEILAEQGANLARGLTADQNARIVEIETRRRAGHVTEAELVERVALIWPEYFVVREVVRSPPAHVGVEASIETNRSIAEHFARRTLMRELPGLRLPALFVHGEGDPLPPRSTELTASLIQGARVELIADCGHFPWLEQPEQFREAVRTLLGSSEAG